MGRRSGPGAEVGAGGCARRAGPVTRYRAPVPATAPLPASGAAVGWDPAGTGVWSGARPLTGGGVRARPGWTAEARLRVSAFPFPAASGPSVRKAARPRTAPELLPAGFGRGPEHTGARPSAFGGLLREHPLADVEVARHQEEDCQEKEERHHEGCEQ